jgi:hypothetical protein
MFSLILRSEGQEICAMNYFRMKCPDKDQLVYLQSVKRKICIHKLKSIGAGSNNFNIEFVEETYSN